MESVNQKNNEQESSGSSARSCAENSNHDKIIGSDASCDTDSNQKGDTTEILNESIDPHSDLEFVTNVKDMLMEEMENHKNKVLGKICVGGECDENLVKVEKIYGLSRVSMLQSAGFENGDEQQETELDSVQNDSTKLPLINPFYSYQEAIDSDLKRVCLKDHIDMIANGNEIESNDNQGLVLISEEGQEYIDESKTNENGKGTDHGDRKTDSNDGFCSSGIGRIVEVDKENEIENKFEIESPNSSPSLDWEEQSKDVEKEKEMINVATPLTEYKDTNISQAEIMEVVDDESFTEFKLLESDKAEGMEITNHSLTFSDSIQEDVNIIEPTTWKKEDSESFGNTVEERTEQMDRKSGRQLKEHELHTTSITEEQMGSIEEVAQLILLQSVITQKEMEEQIIPQSDPTQQEIVVEGEKEELIFDQSDPIQQETTLVQGYLVSVNHSQELQKEHILLESGTFINDSEEEESFHAKSSNPAIDTSVLAPESEDPTSQASKVVEISSFRSGELFVLSMHKTDEQEQNCDLMAFEGVHDSNKDSEILENSDTFSFEFENPFAGGRTPVLQSQKEESEQNPSLHLQRETVKNVASATESGHSELDSDRKDINVPVEVIKTDVSTHQVKIGESEKSPLLQQPNANFHSELEKPIAKNRISELKASKEEPTEATMLLQKTSAGSEVLSSEGSDSRKFKTPIQRVLKEENCVVESLQKQESIVLKETVDEAWKSTNKVTSTSPGERKKHKPRYSLFGNCMCCTTVQ